MRGYVVSLARRPDRLAAFRAHLADTGLHELLDLEHLVAVDGSTLDLEALKPRISQGNFKLEERNLRGHLGATMSHLEAWRRISAQPEPMLVLEDDARLASGIDAGTFKDSLRRLPPGFDMVFLNDYNYPLRAGFESRLRNKLSRMTGLALGTGHVRFSAMPDLLSTTEAYIVTPSHSRRLFDAIVNNMGAIDRHIQLANGKGHARVFQTEPPLFGQADRTDSDTGGPIYTK